MNKVLLLLSVLLIFPLYSLNAADKKDDTEILKQQVEQLQDRIEKLENNATVAYPSDPDFSDKIRPDFPPELKMSKIELRESFNDKQEAAARPYDLTLDPNYRGFIPIPHTHGMIRFNARPRVDTTLDNTYTGNDNRFVTALIPVSGEAQKGGGTQFNMNGQGSQLSMDVRAPGTTGDPRFYYENDFSGNGTAYLNFKVRHLYGQMFNIIVGQTFTVFEDADAWPDTVDYEGPNAAISARRPLLRYMLVLSDEWHMNFSMEKSDSQVDTTGDPLASSENHAPDGGFNIRWERANLGHVQFGTIFRELGVSSGVFSDQKKFGWGLNLSSSIALFKNDSFQTQLTYGEGINYFLNDAVENYDAAFNAAGELVPIPVIALMGGYTHTWSNKFRSTASFGFVNLENTAMQAWNAYHRTYYASANLVYQLFKRLSFGVEGLYGYKQVKSGASGDAFRGQFTVMYELFR